MVVGGSQQRILDLSLVLLGTRQQGVPVILRELMLPDLFRPGSFSFTIRDTNSKTQFCLKQIDFVYDNNKTIPVLDINDGKLQAFTTSNINNIPFEQVSGNSKSVAQ
ncbi:unnamed protein product [Schistosoma margrebowiei]|uniref:Uncharacterized protein n=1 Tax=Schistosoma margrebowiei TaxID=48269 RepID=A0A183M427_9TREM|nr:unnamed protein product [Schistosoma margrebowiei]